MAAPHFSAPDAILVAKARLRTQTAEFAKEDADGASASATIATGLRTIVSTLGSTRVATFWPMRGEPALVPLMTGLDGDGVVVLLPRILDREHALRFDRWRPERGVRPGRLGTSIADAPPRECDLDPDLILVPLLAFDRACRRLGRGGGFYDRTLLHRAGVPAIGVAFASAERSEIPCEPHDRVLDAVVTERATFLAPASRIAPR